MTDPILFNSKASMEVRFLSNFYPARVCVDLTLAHDPRSTYPTSEHLYQALRCELPEDREKIWLCRHPAEAKKLAKVVKTRDGWDRMKVDVMRRVLRLKFSEQNPDLKRRLLATGEAELVEFAPWKDHFWGVDADGVGENTMGKLLMELRKELRG